MNCWDILGLDEEVDERTIKRQYAKLLKVHRPDEDAEAFQQLREAYEEALSWVRERIADEAEETPWPVTALSEGPLFAPIEPVTHGGESVMGGLAQDCPLAEAEEPASLVGGAPRPRPAPDYPEPALTAEALARHEAKRLLEEASAENLKQKWVQAQELNCTIPFQAGLVERCLHHDETDLLVAAVEHLQWLTPWQSAALSPSQEAYLAAELLGHQREPLDNLGEAGNELGFLAQLRVLSKQPWANSFDRQQQLQGWVLEMLDEADYLTPSLFEGVCCLFGWDDRKGIVPAPYETWCALVERCEQEAYALRLQQLLNAEPTTPEGKAAHLLLGPISHSEQIRLAKAFKPEDRVARETLRDNLNHRYPGLKQRFPDARLDAFVKVEPKEGKPLSYGWIWAGAALFALFYTLPQRWQEGRLDLFTLFYSLTLWPLIAVWVTKLLTRLWRPVAKWLEPLDLILTYKVLPGRLFNPEASRWMLLRNGIPLALMALFMGQKAGLIALGIMGSVAYACFVRLPAGSTPFDAMMAYYRRNDFSKVTRLILITAVFIAIGGLVGLVTRESSPNQKVPVSSSAVEQCVMHSAPQVAKLCDKAQDAQACMLKLQKLFSEQCNSQQPEPTVKNSAST
ncbi:J domain-containing protein [Pseudomonas asuensis]|nr:J domain-containing protein [Pseudomonas asuensis]